MAEVRTFRDLLVWQRAMQLVKEVYQASQRFPREEMYGLTAQLRRSAVSIPSNIAEGHGRHATSDYVRFLRIATGSLFELQTQIEIAKELMYLQDNDHEKLDAKSRELERMLTSMVNKLVAKKGR